MPPLLGQFCFLTTVVFLFPPPQSKAKPIVDLGNCLPVGEKVEGNVMIIIGKGGKVNRVWQESRTALAVLMVLLLTAYETLAVSLCTHLSGSMMEKYFIFPQLLTGGGGSGVLNALFRAVLPGQGD